MTCLYSCRHIICCWQFSVSNYSIFGGGYQYGGRDSTAVDNGDIYLLGILSNYICPCVFVGFGSSFDEYLVFALFVLFPDYA